MAKYIGPKFKLCRREGINLYGNRKCDLEGKNFPPGQHGNKRQTKLSNYGIQLREKQKVKRIYGVLERQFRRFYAKASRSKGVTGEMLLQLLERRLDNVIYRMGYATTRSQARQIVNHGKVLVNDKKVNIPSYIVKVGDEITLKLKEKNKKFIDDNIEANKDQAIVKWLTVDSKHYKGKIAKLPEREDVLFPISEQLIVELYSK